MSDNVKEKEEEKDRNPFTKFGQLGELGESSEDKNREKEKKQKHKEEDEKKERPTEEDEKKERPTEEDEKKEKPKEEDEKKQKLKEEDEKKQKVKEENEKKREENVEKNKEDGKPGYREKRNNHKDKSGGKKVNKSSENKSEGREEEEKAYDHFAVIPPNGGWGWMVVATAFYCNVVTDGIQFTFGVFMKAISDSLEAEFSKVALAGSMMFGIHLLMGPLCSGVTSVFGLRLVTVVGALICSVGVALAYFATNFWVLCITYGLIGGIGLGLVYMNSLVITGIYFTSLMPIAIGIVVCGTGVGTMIFAALGHFLLNITTWQNTMLINSALSASMAVAALAFKPLKPIKVKLSKSNLNISTMNVTSSASMSKTRSVFIRKEVPIRPSITSTRTIHSYIWNALLQNEVVKDLQRKEQNRCKCCKPFNFCNRKKKKDDVLFLSEIKHDIVRPEVGRRKSYVEKSEYDPFSPTSSVATTITQDKKMKTQNVFERVEYKKRPKKSFLHPLKQSLQATVDCHLLASCAFFLFTLSGALQMAALLVVYIYEKDRCKDLGFTEEMSVYFIITLGGANTFWRLFLGAIAIIPKVNAHLVAVLGITIGGIATICSGLSNDVYFQFAFCFFYSLGMASFAVFRLVLLLDLVRPEESVNATGINLLFMGFFCIVAPPLFGWAMEITHSYDVIFLSSGFIIIASAILLIGVKKLRKKELEKLNDTV